MSAFDALQRIFEGQEPNPVWSRLNPEVGPPFGGVEADHGLALSLMGLEVVFVFDGEGRLLGAYNWKE